MENTTTHPRIVPITQTYQPVLNKSAFVAALALFGVFYMLAGIINLVTAIILFSNASPSLANPLLIGTVHKLSLGALISWSSWAFSRGKLLSVWLYAGSLIADSLYNLMTGYSLNYVFIAFGLLLIWQTLKYRSQLELK
jgi:hypothetical protein